MVANVPVNPSLPQTNNSLSAQVGAAPPQTLSATPHTPAATSHTPSPTPSSPVIRGKRIKFDPLDGVPEDASANQLPTTKQAMGYKKVLKVLLLNN